MPKLNTAQGQSQAAPTLGLNFKDPLAEMDPHYTPWSSNICWENQFGRLRNGMNKFCGVTTNTDQLLALAVQHGATDVVWGITVDALGLNFYAADYGVSLTHPASRTAVNYFNGIPANDPANIIFSSFFNKCVYFFDASGGYGSGKPGAFFEPGVGWAAINYTYSANAGNPTGAVAFKGHHYIYSSQNLNVEFSDLGAIQGNTTSLDLSQFFTAGTGMAWGASFTTQDGNVNQQYLAFCSDAGQVLVYSGSTPGDGGDFALVCIFEIGKPIGMFPTDFNRVSLFDPVIQYQSDALVMHRSGLVSLRQLFTNGEDALNKTVSDEINAYWIKLIQMQQAQILDSNEFSPPFWSGAFYPEQKKIIIATAGSISKTGSYSPDYCTFFVLNTLTGAWSIYNQRIGAVATGEKRYFGYPQDISYANGALFYICSIPTQTNGNYVFQFEDSTQFEDYIIETNLMNPYGYELDLPWNNLGSSVLNKDVSTVELFVNSDLFTVSGGLQVSTSVDFGVRTNGPDQQLLPTSQAGFQKLSYNVGESGTFFQAQITGSSEVTSSALGFQLFATNIILTVGGAGG